MDSKAILDYALFQLTPTRTRCELVVFSGAVYEKIASGLFEPFVSHLKFAKDEISKGGYSIKLLPPNHGAPWFSKATFERFVRFVSTPAVLERFVSIEREIQQIESSYQANKLSMSNSTLDEGIMPPSNGNARRSSDSTKLNGELEGDDNKEEENSKISLQRLLESRIALLQKEQAMAYARGLVAGFEIDNIDGLIYFANAFGAFRLREACIGFKELWKKKHADDLWIKEVAALQSCLPSALSFSGTSGIILANEIPSPDQNNKSNNSKDSISASDEKNGSLETSSCVSTTNSATSNRKEDDKVPPSDQIPSHTANFQVPMSWPYNVPPFMCNLQSPMQQMPPYQGYPLTNVQSVPPPYLLRNMHWPSNLENSTLSKDPNSRRNPKSSSRRKEKHLFKQGLEDIEDQQTESSDPDSRSASNSDDQLDSKHSSKDDTKKKHRRKSSGTVVIRNINYITPKRGNGNEGGVSDESSIDDDDVITEETIKQKVGIALESLQKVHKVDKHGNKKAGVARRSVNKLVDASEQDLGENLSDASEGGKKKENWDAFQNLLKIDGETGIDGAERLQPINVQDEHFVVRNSEERMSYSADASADLEFKEVPKQPKVPNDSFIVTQRDGGNEGGVKLDEYVDSCGPVKKRRDYMGEEILFSRRLEESGNELGNSLSACVANASVNKCKNAEDWFIVDHSEKRSPDPVIVPTVFDGDCILSSVDDCSHAKKRSGCAPVDDSFMIQGQLADNDLSDSQWKTDISIVADLNSATKLENGTSVSQNKHEFSKNQEPNDLCVVLQRDSALDALEASWTVDYEIDFSYSETDRRSSFGDLHDNKDKKLPFTPKKTDKSNASGMRNSGKDEKTIALRGSSGKVKSEIMCRNKKPSPVNRPIVQKSKLEKEEEIRKKMEELLIERQRRIAERTAANGLARAVPKKDQIESKTAMVSTRSDKNKTKSMKEMNRISSVKVRAI